MCSLCDYPFSYHTKETYVKTENGFVCWYCDAEFAEKIALAVHIKIGHGGLIYGNDSVSWYSCCGKLYMRVQHLVRHVKRVHQREVVQVEDHLVSTLQDVMYPCEVCGNLCILSKRCKLHKKLKSTRRKCKLRRKSSTGKGGLEMDTLVCWYCEQGFVDKEVLELHIKVIHGRIAFSNPDLTWYACKECCDKLYMRAQDIVKHMRNVHARHIVQTDEFKVESLTDITFTCIKCSTDCILSKTCVEHKEKVVLKDDRYISESYDIISSVPSECVDHTYLDKCHACQCCDLYFDECNHLWSHMLSEHKPKHKVCNLCPEHGVRVKSATFLTRHMSKVHRKSLKLQIVSKNDELKEKSKVIVDGCEMYKCLECGALLKNIWSLREHLMIHTGEKPHVCDVCSKSFRNRGKLNVHYKRVHQQVRDHQCTYCGRAFSDKSNLNVHIRTHTDEKKYMCELCGADFAQWATLYNHKFTHNNIKFQCTYCEKVYNNPSNLQRHMKTHTDDSLYICEICGKDFGTARYLKRHKDTHNSVNAFVCEMCNAGFKVKKHLTQHYKTHSIFMPSEQFPLINPVNNVCERALYKL